jgi:hypothetical protein
MATVMRQPFSAGRQFYISIQDIILYSDGLPQRGSDHLESAELGLARLGFEGPPHAPVWLSAERLCAPIS